MAERRRVLDNVIEAYVDGEQLGMTVPTRWPSPTRLALKSAEVRARKAKK